MGLAGVVLEISAERSRESEAGTITLLKLSGQSRRMSLGFGSTGVGAKSSEDRGLIQHARKVSSGDFEIGAKSPFWAREYVRSAVGYSSGWASNLRCGLASDEDVAWICGGWCSRKDTFC